MKLKKTQKKKIYNLIYSLIIILIALIMGIINKEDIIGIINLKIDETSTKNIEKNPSNINNIEPNIPQDKYKVVRVVDGDTIQIEYNGVKEKVRLIGVDTPESVHPDDSKNIDEGKIASDYTKSLLENNFIKLEFDVQERDKYGRLLAYVYINDEMLNKILLKEGYAKLATYPPNVKYVEEFTEIQKKARENTKGFWADNIF